MPETRKIVEAVLETLDEELTYAELLLIQTKLDDIISAKELEMSAGDSQD